MRLTLDSDLSSAPERAARFSVTNALDHLQLIGINSQILSPSGGNIGIGFAIPSNMAKAVMDQLLKTGKVRRGMLGVSIL